MKNILKTLALPFVKLFNKIKNLSVKGKVILVSSFVALIAVIVAGCVLLNNYRNRTLTITFDSQFGTPVPAVSIKRGDVFEPTGSSLSPERTGMTFTGWYFDKAAKTPYKNEPIKKNTTLYAGWVATGLSVSRNLGQLPNNTSFTIFSTEKIASSQFGDYILLTNLCGSENEIIATEQTNKSSTGYYYKITFEKPFDADGIYSFKLLKPTKAWVTDVNGKALSDRVSTDYSFTIDHLDDAATAFDKAEITSSDFSDAVLAAIVNGALDSFRAALNKRCKELGIDGADKTVEQLNAASFGIGPEAYISAKKPALNSSVSKSGLAPVFTTKCENGKAVIGFSLTDGTLVLGSDSANSSKINISLSASETYTLTDVFAEKNAEYASMSSDFYRTVLRVNSKLNFKVTATVVVPADDKTQTITLDLADAPKTIAAYFNEILPYVKNDSETEADTDAAPVTDIVLAKATALFGCEETEIPSLTVEYTLSLDKDSSSLTDAVANCTADYFATNGLRTFDDSKMLSDISNCERPVYGKLIAEQSADFKNGSVLVSTAHATLGTQSLSMKLTTGISKDAELVSKATFNEKGSSQTLNIADSKQPLSKPASASADATGKYLKAGETSIQLFSRFLDLTAANSGNGTRYLFVEDTASSEAPAEEGTTPSVKASELGLLPNPADVKISLQNVDIPYYIISAGEFEKPEKDAASLISISNGRIRINPACNKAAFDLVIRPKDTRFKDDSTDYSDARVIHVSFEMLKNYKPCKATVYDTEGIELFSGTFNTGDTISADFSSPSNKAQFLVYAQYNTNIYQPSTLGFYDAPMGQEGNKLSGLIALTGNLNLYLTLKTSFNEIEWYCRYGTEIDKNIKAKTRFTYNGTETEIIHPDIPEITIIPGEYEDTEVKLIGFSNNYTIVDGKYKRYNNVGYIDLTRTKISYQAHIFIKYPDVDEPIEYAVLPGKYDTDFVFPDSFLDDLSKVCEVVGFCNGKTIPAGVNPETYEAWAADKDIFAAPGRDVAEVFFCALARYNPGKIESILTNSTGEVVQRKTIFQSVHITPDRLLEERDKIPQSEFTLFWNAEKSSYDIYRFSGYSDPETTFEDNGYSKNTTILSVYKYVGQTDIATIDFKSDNCGLTIYSRDLLENPESDVIRKQPDDFTYSIVGSTGHVNGTEIRPSDVNFVAPELDLPEEYKNIIVYHWVDENDPSIILDPDTMYSMNIVPETGLVLRPVFEDIRIVELEVTDGVITETTFVYGNKGTRMTEDAVISAAVAVNPALSELSSEVPFPLYYFGNRDTFDSPVIVDHLVISFRHKFKQVRLHTGDGGPFEDNTILQIIEGEPDTPIKESAAKRIKELSTTSENPAYIRGYTFLGYAETPDGEPRPLSSFTYSNQDLYAIYSRYTKWGVTFSAGDGKFKDNANSKTLFVLDGSFPEIAENPSIAGKAFTGWTDADGKRLDPSRIEIHSSVTYYASYDYNTFKVELKIDNVSTVYDGKVHTPDIRVSGLPAGYTCSVTADFSSKDVTNGKKTVSYKDILIIDNKGHDVTSRARITVIYGSLEIKPARLIITTDSITASYTNEYSNIAGTGQCVGAVADEFIDFKVTGFINFYNTENPSLAEWQRSFFQDHGYVEASNTWQINWNNSTAKQSNYTIDENLGTLRLVKRYTATFKCNNAFLLKTGNANEARSILTVAAESGIISEKFTCSFEIDSGSNLTSTKFPFIWNYAPYFESDDITFNTKYLKQITGSDIRSITINRTSDNAYVGEIGLDAIWSFKLDDNYTFQINLK